MPDLSFAPGDTGLLRLAALLDKQQANENTSGWLLFNVINFMEIFNLRRDDYHNLFSGGLRSKLIISLQEVQPHHVATAIRQFVFKRNPGATI